MSRYAYERLTALDNSFLIFESANTPMHVATAATFEATPLRHADGGVDMQRILHYVESRLHLMPRYRERLAYIPFEDHPVWVDDERFNILYHVRHTALPRPGSERQLKRLCARILSQQLDRGKPLWEMWVIEGVEGNRLAIITKMHHCMIDGIAGVDLLASLMTNEPSKRNASIPEPKRWIPRPTPTPRELLRDEILTRLQAPLSLLGQLLQQPSEVLANVRAGAAAVAEVLQGATHLASDTPLNRPIGPHRRFDWLTMEMDALQEIREHLGGTLNEVVLTIVSGAVRRFLTQRNIDVDQIDFRVFVPVNVRQPEAHAKPGNQVAAWIIDLPVREPDVLQRHEQLRRHTDHAKHSQQTKGTQILVEATEWTGTTVLGLATQLMERTLPFNMVVTNVPGPPKALYLLGARMLALHPMVPLFVNQGLGVALFSNAGRLFWGFNADWDVVPDLHQFVEAISASFEELHALAAPRRTATPRRRRRAA